MMNKRGQIVAIIGFVLVIILLVFLAPFIMKIVLTPTQKFAEAIGTVDTTNKSVEGITTITGTFTRMFDWVILAFFIINMIVLIASAFLIQVHPAFLVIYILAVGFLVIFGSQVTDILKEFYNITPEVAALCNDGTISGTQCIGSSFVGSEALQYLPLTKFLVDYFWQIIMGIVFITGIIMYGKLKAGGEGSTY